MLDPVNLHKDLIEMPLPLGVLTKVSRTLGPDLLGEDRAEPVDTEADTLMTDVNTALMKQIFDVAEREREADIHHNGQLDDFARRLEVAKRVLVHD